MQSSVLYHFTDLRIATHILPLPGHLHSLSTLLNLGGRLLPCNIEDIKVGQLFGCLKHQCAFPNSRIPAEKHKRAFYKATSQYPVQLGNIRSEAACHLRSEEHTSELQSRGHLVCRLLLEKKKK